MQVRSLSTDSQDVLLSELITIKANSEYNLLDIRERKFNEKQGVCPHCNHMKVRENGEG